MAIIDKFSEFINASRPRLSLEEACRLYEKSGGILKLKDGRLLFPDQERLITQLSEATLRKDNLTSQLRFWQRQHRALVSGNLLDEMAKVTDPLFWEHLVKFSIERDYRTSFEKVDLPMKYMNDDRYRSIIRAFIRDEDYRKRLVKAKTGLLKGATIKESAEKNRDFKRRIIEDKLERLRKEKEELSDRIRVLETLLEWSSGNHVGEEGLVGK
jgi:hypothetical protein